MNADMEEQEDELLALQSIFGSEEFVRDESKSAGEIRVRVELPAHFTVSLREGETLRQYEISFLPPLHLTFELPEDYPSSSPPSFTLTCSWLTRSQLSALGAQLTDLYQATGGAVVLFTWVQFLKEEALGFLDIHTLLELPSEEHSTQNHSQESLHAALSEPKINHCTPESGPTDNQSCNASDPCEPDLSAPSSEAEHPIAVPADDLNPSTSDSEGASALDSSKADQNNLTSDYSKDSQNGPNSEPKADYQKTSNDSNQVPQASDTEEAEQTVQTSEFKADYQNDLSSAAGKSEPHPPAQSNQSGLEGLSGGNSSSLLLTPSGSSDPLDPSEQGAASLPVPPRESPQSEDQTLSGLSLTPSQALLSQILIYNAAQQEKQFATTVFDCGVCFMGWLGSDCVQLPECGHIFCRACLTQFCKLQITEGNVRGVTCPQADCTATPTPAQVKSLVGEELFRRYDRLLLQITLDCMPDVVYCPRLSCGAVVIREKSSNAAMCSVCSFAFCVNCRKTYHGEGDCRGRRDIKKQMEEDAEEEEEDARQIEKELARLNLPQSQAPKRRSRRSSVEMSPTSSCQLGIMALWDDYASGSKERQRLLESRYGRRVLRDTVTVYLSEDWMAFNSKNCPHCFTRIQKNGGCNFMRCTQCRQVFCWACLSRLPMFGNSSHFVDSTCSAYEYDQV